MSLPQPSFATLPSLKKSSSRLFGLDWLRAGAAVLVVMLHAAIPYMSHPLPGLKWSVLYSEASPAVDLIGWGINGFIMPTFFLMNGYLAAKLLERRGPAAFMKHRLSRIGAPFVFAVLVIIPIDFYIWVLGWFNAGLVPLKTFWRIKIGGELGKSLHGFSHLWFLQYVLVYCLGACLISMAAGKLRSMKWESTDSAPLPFQRRARFLPFLAGIAVAAAMLWIQPRIVIGFRHGWLPFWENLVFYAVPFTLGWFWEKHTPLHASTGRRWGIQLALALLAGGIVWPDLCRHLETEAIPVATASVPFLFATFNVLMSTALFGLAVSIKLDSVPAAVAYVSRASFWVYLFHHPVVALLQVDLVGVQIPVLAKFLIASLTTLAVCLLTYEGWVRRTWIGQLLNGVREESRLARIKREEPEKTPAREAA